MKRFFSLVVITIVSFVAFGQSSSKKNLSTDDFARWKTIQNASISANGKYVAYELNPQLGDGHLIIKNIDSKQEDSIQRGYSPAFSPESDFLVFKIKQPLDSIRKAKLNKVSKEKFPKDSLGILLFKSRETKTFANLKSYSVPKENAEWIAFLTEPVLSKKKKAKENKEDWGEDASDETENSKSDSRSGTLVLYHVKTGDTLQYKKVSELHYSPKGQYILFSQENIDSLKNSRVCLFETTTRQVRIIQNMPGSIRQLATDEQGEQFAFLFSQDSTKQKTYSLYYGKITGEETSILAGPLTRGMPVGWAPSENHRLIFSDDNTRLFLGTAAIPKQEVKDSITDEEKPKLDIWSWHDRELQPQQKVNLDREKKRSYLAVVHLADQKFIQLGDPIINSVDFSKKGNGPFALGRDNSPYRRESSWTGESNADYYLVDLKTGIKRKMLESTERAWLSPEGNFIIWYNPADSSYYSRSTNIQSQTNIRLTKQIPVQFCDEQNDMPENPKPYGIAGWAENDRFVYIYDRYDIWKIDPTGTRVAVNVTRSFGRRNHLQLRYIKLDQEEEFIDPENINIASSFDERSKASGFFHIDFTNFKEPRLLLAENMKFDSLIKAKNVDKVIFTKESSTVFPDLWNSNLKFDHPRKISDANPQQKEFNWATSSLVKWVSFNGDTLEGLLYLPDNFDPETKYPMIVYYYERNADNLYNHYHPAPSRSTINRTFYVSNGYLVFVPDITYRTGFPGQSAYDAIVSGTQHLINNFPFVDRNKIGLQGQSWGGYQTAWLVTQTNMFAAAMAGAPVSNMTSAYGGIRWESGMSRMFQYEHTQSRMGATLWEKPLLYIENSPLFHAPQVKTPLLIMHNDNDGAVPWYQGIEMFVALRRLDKPVWMLTYNGEPHNLKQSSWGNRLDLSIRMKGFFDHYLQGKPMPYWMQSGIPAIDKGQEMGY